MSDTTQKTETEAVPFEKGDLVYITSAGHDWITRSSQMPGVNLAGRTAQLVDIYDWDTDRGKDILEKRKESGKWTSLRSKEFRYIVVVFYPEKSYQDKQGIMHPEMLCLCHPREEGDLPLFERYPAHLMKYITGEEKFVLGDK